MNFKATLNTRIIPALLALALLFCLAACSSEKKTSSIRPGQGNVKETVEIDFTRSNFSDFQVDGEKVIIKCNYVIVSTYSEPKTVKLTGTFQKDQKIGLLQEAELIGVDSRQGGKDSFVVAPGQNAVEVYYVGTFAGTNQKVNLVLPETTLELVAP